MKNPITCEYIWIDGFNDLRSKNRVLYRDASQNDFALSDVPIWNYDGSSTGQAEVNNSEVIIKPCKITKDPFSFGFLVLCDTYVYDAKGNLQPHSSNHRLQAQEIFEKYKEQEPWYGLEQEFFILSKSTGLPVGFPQNRQHLPQPQGKYYCSVGKAALRRDFVQAVYEACHKAGLTVSGLNAEVAPGQWEIQIGPLVGVDAADELWLLRYILKRMSERFKDLCISFEPKPLAYWNGSGCHTNFSTKSMRLAWKTADIQKSMKKLEKSHQEMIEISGQNNQNRLSGRYETSDFKNFTWGYGTRNTSVRIPLQVKAEQKGYLEDRRPASNCDPYLITSKLLENFMKN